MTTMRTLRRGVTVLTLSLLCTAGCRNSGLWNTAAPINELTESALNSPQAAQQAFVAALWQFTAAVYGSNGSGGGVVLWAGLLSDEYMDSYFTQYGSIDARYTSAEETAGTVSGTRYAGVESGDTPIGAMLQARSALLVTVPYLAANEKGSNLALVGHAEALAGYAELFMAEDYCAGVPLTQATAGGGVSFGQPLTTDSLLGAAEAHFRQAIEASAGDTAVTWLASIGLGRALVGRGRFDSAAIAVAAVPTGFVYNLFFSSSRNGGYPGLSFLAGAYQGTSAPNNQIFVGSYPTISNDEGGVGYNYAMTTDPRMTSQALGYSFDGYWETQFYPTAHLADSLIYWPAKFGSTPQTWSAFPLATGVEARMIQAEDTLQQQPGDLYNYLNALRTLAPNTYTNATIPVPIFGGDTASCGGKGDTTCVKIFFRERAFWLFGTGTRLGDMRREERQYGLADTTVYPHGSYWYDPTDSAIIGADAGFSQQSPWTQYGTDVSMTLPTVASGFAQGDVNPNFKGGCLAGTTPATP